MDVVLEERPDKNWNERVLKSINSNFQQTAEYANYIQKRFSYRPIYVKFFDSEELVSQLILFEHSRINQFLRNNHFLIKFSDKFYNNLVPNQNTYTWSYGPILFKSELSDKIYQEFFVFLSKSKKKYRGSFHPLNQSQKKFSEDEYTKSLGTFIIDFSKGKDEIWNNVNYKHAQKNIKKAQDKKLSVTEIKNKEDFDIYYKMYTETRKNANVSIRKYEHIYDLWNMKDVGQKGFIVWKENLPLGGIILSTFGGYMIEYAIARSKKDLELKTFGSDYLKWFTIEWGFENEMKYYDFAGVNPNPENKKDKGILFYKQKWGGKYYDQLLYTNLT